MTRLLIAAMLTVGCGAALAGELKSGPQVGSTIPGPFEPLNLTGPAAGDEDCLFCRFGNAPVAMVFARKPTDGLAKFVRHLEAAMSKADKAMEAGACVIFLDPGDGTKAAARKLADRENLKHVILAATTPATVKDYEINPAADVTVLLYSNRVVRSNHSLRAAELTDKAAEAVRADFEKLLTAK